jgi:hypothetical protein
MYAHHARNHGTAVSEYHTQGIEGLLMSGNAKVTSHEH